MRSANSGAQAPFLALRPLTRRPGGNNAPASGRWQQPILLLNDDRENGPAEETNPRRSQVGDAAWPAQASSGGTGKCPFYGTCPGRVTRHKEQTPLPPPKRVIRLGSHPLDLLGGSFGVSGT